MHKYMHFKACYALPLSQQTQQWRLGFGANPSTFVCFYSECWKAQQPEVAAQTCWELHIFWPKAFSVRSQPSTQPGQNPWSSAGWLTPCSSTRHFRGQSKKTCDNCVIRPGQSETDQVSKLRSFLPPSCQLNSFQQLGFAPQGHQPPSRSSAGESSTSWGICQPQKGALTLLGQERMGCHFQTW